MPRRRPATEPLARHRLDDLRRFATSLGAAAGLPGARAAALATHLLWFDAAGRPEFGLARLPDLLDRVERGEIAPQVEPKVGPERAGTAVLDARHSIGVLALARAAEIAAEKARDVGLGLVRVTGLGPDDVGPAAPVVADLAVGPVVGLALGPGAGPGPLPAWALAVPSAEGLPVVYDTALGGGEGPGPPALGPWSILPPEGDYLVFAAETAALEPLESLRLRAAEFRGDRPALLLPATWEARRREAREQGVPIETDAWKAMTARAKRLGVEVPGH